jgi:hypothetical protein
LKVSTFITKAMLDSTAAFAASAPALRIVEPSDGVTEKEKLSRMSATGVTEGVGEGDALGAVEESTRTTDVVDSSWVEEERRTEELLAGLQG